MIKEIYKLIDRLYWGMSHKWSNAYSSSYGNESYPIHQCQKCGEISEINELDFCSKFYKRIKEPVLPSFEDLDLPF